MKHSSLFMFMMFPSQTKLHYDIHFLCYVDDTQLCLSVKQNSSLLLLCNIVKIMSTLAHKVFK